MQKMPKGLTTRLNIFKARFDIASRLQSMTFSPDFTDSTTQAYFAGTRLVLAYSAGEALARAEDKLRNRKPSSITNWSISRAGLAKELRPLVTLILENAEKHGTLNSNTRKYLEQFHEGNKSNIRPVATALRHFHAHGGLTARSITGSDDEKQYDFAPAVDGLAWALLEKCDEKFTKMMGEIRKSINIKH